MRLGLFFCVCAALLLSGCDRSASKADDTTLGYRLPPGETHLTFTFPEIAATGSFKGRPAVTFRIPREYVRFQGVLSRNGQQWGPGDNDWAAWHPLFGSEGEGVNIAVRGPDWGVETHLSQDGGPWYYQGSVAYYRTREIGAITDTAGDIAFGGAGNDHLGGGWGEDHLDGGDDHNVVDGGGDDVMYGVHRLRSNGLNVQLLGNRVTRLP